jgi:hypothetical protein
MIFFHAKRSGSIFAAVPIWHNFMIEALKKYQPNHFLNQRHLTLTNQY